MNTSRYINAEKTKTLNSRETHLRRPCLAKNRQ